MPELRKDPITREWVIIATERGRRPNDFARPADERTIGANRVADCPFCPGNESKTPPELLAFREEGGAPDGSGWRVRVVPNRFAALQTEGEPLSVRRGIYESMSGVGAHEVVIETSEHGKDLAWLDVWQVEEVLWAYRQRYIELRKDERFKYISIFRNHGRTAGASLEHAHSQIIATPIIPWLPMMKIKGVEHYREYFQRCIYCDTVEQELGEEERLVSVNDSFISFAPYASRYPMETWIMPRERSAHFIGITAGQMRDLAAILKETLLRLDLCLDDPPYNYMLLTTDFTENFHWHIEIVPRLTVEAGFELGTGIHVNTIAPEQAVAYLRAIDLRDAWSYSGKNKSKDVLGRSHFQSELSGNDGGQGAKTGDDVTHPAFEACGVRQEQGLDC